MTAARSRWRVAALVLLAFSVTGAVLARFAGRWRLSSLPSPAASAPELLVSVVSRTHVGEDVVVTVGGVDNRQPSVALVLLAGYGVRAYRIPVRGRTARLKIPGADLTHSGVVTLLASAGKARGSASMTLEPGAAIDPVTPLVGARSIIADGKHWSLCTVVPFDQFGNPLPEETPVQVRALHPGGALETREVPVHHLLAWVRIFSRTLAGRTAISATTQGRFGPEATLLEVPGWPAGFGLRAEPDALPADGRQFLSVRSDVIRDRYGNSMLDGTLVTFVANTPGNGVRFAPAFTLDAVAQTLLQAPIVPMTMVTHAVIYNTPVQPLEYEWRAGPAVNTFPVAARFRPKDQDFELTAGPLVAALNQFVPDGTPVNFVLRGEHGDDHVAGAVADEGYARALVANSILRSGHYSVSVTLGVGYGSTRLQVP